MSTHNSPQEGPEDHARLAEDFPSPSAAMHMDMTAELERQAAAEAMTAAEEDMHNEHARTLDEAGDLEHQLHGGHLEHDSEGMPSPIPMQAGPSRSRSIQLSSFYTPTPQAPSTSHVPANRQLEIMREFYVRNPQPSRAELDMLAEKTGRTWRKVREYFRQRRNKGRGWTDLEQLTEPARATGWSVFFAAASTSSLKAEDSGYS